MPTALRASLTQALASLPAPTAQTLDANTLQRLRTCAALGAALARVRSAGAVDADLARVVYATYMYLVHTLAAATHAIHEADRYWTCMYRSRVRAGMLWLQTLPARIATSTSHVFRRPMPGFGVRTGIHTLQRESHAKHVRLRRAEDAMAKALGTLALAWYGRATDASLPQQIQALCEAGCTALAYKPGKAPQHSTPLQAVATLLDAVAYHEASVARVLQVCGTPSVLTRTWPLLVTYPLISWAATHYLYLHWTSVSAQATWAWDTVRGLLLDWVYEPTMRLLRTMRMGRAERSMLVRRDSLAADEQSLERMVLAMGRDTLRMNDQALAQLAAQTRDGNLTAVLEVYERALASPVRATLSGQLIRTILIQVQKAKVDLEVALSAIDWLLRSQELLIGVAGLAPALGLAYLLAWGVGRVTSWVWHRPASYRTSRRQRQVDAWEALRRVDQLCIEADDKASAELAYGRFLLHIRMLRTSFEALLPKLSRGDRALLQRLSHEADHDLMALERVEPLPTSTAHAWTQRQAVVARMWRSWHRLLAWDI